MTTRRDQARRLELASGQDRRFSRELIEGKRDVEVIGVLGEGPNMNMKRETNLAVCPGLVQPQSHVRSKVLRLVPFPAGSNALPRLVPSARVALH